MWEREEVYLKLYIKKTKCQFNNLFFKQVDWGLKASPGPTTLVDIEGKAKLKATKEFTFIYLPTIYLFTASCAMYARHNSGTVLKEHRVIRKKPQIPSKVSYLVTVLHVNI